VRSVILCAYTFHVAPVSAAAAWSTFVLSFCQACTVPTFTEDLLAGMRPFLCSVKLLVIDLFSSTVEVETISSALHIRNHQNEQIKFYLDQQQIKYEPIPKYLGINLDRSLSFKYHIEHLKSKVLDRVSLFKQLPGTKWGVSYRIPIISALAPLNAPPQLTLAQK